MKNKFNALKTIKHKSVVCTISGGLDSAVSAAVFAAAGFDLFFIFFDWGQKTFKKELKCAKSLSKHYQVDLKIVEVPILKSLPEISLTQRETLTNAANEYVVNRNAILECQAVAYAEFLKAGAVCIGSTGGDVICPDSSPQFIKTMQLLINEGTLLKPSIQIVAPLILTNKIGAVKLGIKLRVPFEFTWSCHNNLEIPCDVCTNCKARFNAFALNNLADPIYTKIKTK